MKIVKPELTRAKISDVEKKLEELGTVYGDLEVWVYDGEYDSDPLYLEDLNSGIVIEQGRRKDKGKIHVVIRG